MKVKYEDEVFLILQFLSLFFTLSTVYACPSASDIFLLYSILGKISYI